MTCLLRGFLARRFTLTSLVTRCRLSIQQAALSPRANTLHSGIAWSTLHGPYHLLTNKGLEGAVLDEVRPSLLLTCAAAPFCCVTVCEPVCHKKNKNKTVLHTCSQRLRCLIWCFISTWLKHVFIFFISVFLLFVIFK